MWVPHVTHVGTMWFPVGSCINFSHGSHVGPCRGHVGIIWVS